MIALDLADTIPIKLMLTQSHKHHKSTLEVDSPTDQRALQTLDKLAQPVQELMTHPRSLETMPNHSLLVRNVPKKLEKESVLDSILLRELKL